MHVEEFLAHHGVKGMKWGIRRNPKTGVRPIAKTLNKSAFGRMSKKNVDRHNAQKSQGKISTSEKAAIGLAVAGGASAVAIVLGRHGAKQVADLGHTVFEAKDASGKVVGKMGTALYPETIRMLRGG